MPTEFEVFNPFFDALLEPVVCQNRGDAENVLAALVKQSLAACPGAFSSFNLSWKIREVEAGKRPMPPTANVPTPVLVDEVRKLMAKHGQNLMVTFAWSAKTGVVNIATAGDCRKHSEWAYLLSQKLATVAGVDFSEKLDEDRREEHQA
jgi:hypothetical protein